MTSSLPRPVQQALKDLKQALSEIYGQRLSGIYLYGSYARGDFGKDSDIDLIIALKEEVNPWHEINCLNNAVSTICLNYDLLISTYPVPEKWLSERQSPLFENVRREGVAI